MEKVFGLKFYRPTYSNTACSKAKSDLVEIARLNDMKVHDEGNIMSFSSSTTKIDIHFGICSETEHSIEKFNFYEKNNLS